MWTVKEYISLLRCFKCCSFYHFAKDCIKEEMSGNCAKRHATKDCMNQIKKCVNCEGKIKKYKNDLNSDHSAYNKNCPCYKKEIEKLKSRIHCNNL